MRRVPKAAAQGENTHPGAQELAVAVISAGPDAGAAGPRDESPGRWRKVLSRLSRLLSPAAAGHDDGPPAGEVLAIEQFSLAGLQAEFQLVSSRIEAAEQKLEDLRREEQVAMEARDKTALDRAWTERDATTGTLQALRVQREVIARALSRRFEPDLRAWRQRAQAEVEHWRAQDHDDLQALVDHLRQVETIVSRLRSNSAERELAKDRLRQDLQSIYLRAAPLELPEPAVDWTLPFLDFSAVADRLEEILIELPSIPGDEADGDRLPD